MLGQLDQSLGTTAINCRGSLAFPLGSSLTARLSPRQMPKQPNHDLRPRTVCKWYFCWKNVSLVLSLSLSLSPYLSVSSLVLFCVSLERVLRVRSLIIVFQWFCFAINNFGIRLAIVRWRCDEEWVCDSNCAPSRTNKLAVWNLFFVNS